MLDVINKLNRDAESIRNTDPQSLRTMEPGDEFRQGDLRVIRLKDDFVSRHRADLEATKPVSQLAPGQTQGSRHILKSVDGCKFHRLKNATPLDGPIVEITEGNAITHPEHGDVIDMPAGCYAFPGQRAFADELRRVAD